MKTLLLALAPLALGLTLWLAPRPVAAQAPTAPADALRAALQLQGDAARGKAAYEECSPCHRKDASGRVTGAIPRLSGQHATVIVKQLLDIRDGRRNNPPMKPIVEEPVMTLQLFADLAAYLQGLPVTGRLDKGPGGDTERGRALYEKDCAACHGPRGEGRAESFVPMLAAQHHSYLMRELTLIRDGGRGNSNPAMVTLVKTYAQPDLQAVAAYLAQLPAPVASAN